MAMLEQSQPTSESPAVTTTVTSEVATSTPVSAVTPDTQPAQTSMDMFFGSGEALSSSSPPGLSQLYAPALPVVSTSTTQPPSAALPPQNFSNWSTINQLVQQDRPSTTTSQAPPTTTSNPPTASLLFPDLTVSGHAIGKKLSRKKLEPLRLKSITILKLRS